MVLVSTLREVLPDLRHMNLKNKQSVLGENMLRSGSGL